MKTKLKIVRDVTVNCDEDGKRCGECNHWHFANLLCADPRKVYCDEFNDKRLRRTKAGIFRHASCLRAEKLAKGDGRK